MKPTFEHFDHTADLGVRVRAATPAELVAPAARGLYAAIGEIVSAGDGQSVKLEFNGNGPALVLRDFLSELLVIFERDRRFAAALDVHAFDTCRLAVTVTLEFVDFDRSALFREVKAVTYHELSIHAIDGGLEAVFIVDI